MIHPRQAYRLFSRRRRKRVVIVGANFAGLKAASELDRDFSVSVIDPHPYLEFFPNIHEILSDIKQPDLLRFSKEQYVKRAGHRFFLDRVTHIDIISQMIKTRSGRSFDFQACLLAVGGVSARKGIPGALRYALPFKTVANCVAVRNRLQSLADQNQPKTIIIVGGGIEGVEVLGELLRRHRLSSNLSFCVLESRGRLLPGLPAGLDAEIRRLCRPYPVIFRTGVKVTKVTSKTLHLSTGEILPSNLTLWTAGARAPDFLAESGLSPQPGEWAPVTSTLQSRSSGRVLVAGDAALLPYPIAKQAYHAMDMGVVAAQNIERLLNGNSLKVYKKSVKPILIAFGDLDTFLVAGKHAIAGPALASLKEGVYQYVMTQFDPGGRFDAITGVYRRAKSGLETFMGQGWASIDGLKQMADIRWITSAPVKGE